ncbi:MAG: spore coat protein U domain-containing protein [Zetaproteobacteria bacterium]|nr:spore coat protein U domain-containing protein [Zetaproteobacteria bacterium]
MFHYNKLKVLLCCMLCIAPSTLYAAGVTLPSCSVSSIPLNFGIYWGNAPLNSQTRITTKCTIPTTTRVQMNKGLNSVNFITRKMAAGQNTINYNLYTNAAHSRVWGDGTSGTFTLTGNLLTVYASIPTGQVVKAGTYNDTVVVTIIW